jgi:hypothetical protein
VRITEADIVVCLLIALAAGVAVTVGIYTDNDLIIGTGVTFGLMSIIVAVLLAADAIVVTLQKQQSPPERSASPPVK